MPTLPIPQLKATGFLTNPQQLLGDSQRQVLELFNTQNIILFAAGLTVIIGGIILLCYLLLFGFHKLNALFDNQGKKAQFLEIYFDQYINYEDTKFLQLMDNLFKRLDQIIRNSGQIVSFEIHKSVDNPTGRGTIKFAVSSSNTQTLDTIKSLLLGIDGLKIHKLEITELQKNRIAELCSVKKVVYKNQISPIYFKSNNIFSDIVQSLSSVEYQNAGCVVMFRSSKAKRQFLGFKRQADLRSKNPKRRDQYQQEEKSKLIIEKTNHGELMQARIYVYGVDNNRVNTLASSFASSSLNNDVQVRRVFGGEKQNLNKRYLPPEFSLFKPLFGYSIVNSYELAHIIRPIYTSLQNNLQPNIVTIPTETSSKTLLNLNSNGDSISEENAFLNIIAFGDPNSGKSSAFIGNITKSYFNKNYGMLFTVFKSEEVPVILNLVKLAGRESDLILLNKNSPWRTNVINAELNSTGSIKNVIALFDKINKILAGNTNLKNSGDPFWDNASKNLFASLLKITILFYGSFSFSVFEYISELASEYARAKNSENDPKVSDEQKSKQEIFENILKSIEQNNDKKTSSIKLDSSEVSKVLTYFTVDWINMPAKTRESVYTVFRSNLDVLSNGFIAKLLFSDLPTDNPNYFEISSTRKGKIIILDIPVSREKEEGRVFQEIVKGFWQSEMIAKPSGLPCVLTSDEFQQFGSSSDVDFLSVNRSYNVAMILATQNYTSLVDKLGEIKARRLLGNIQTKFFFQTSDKNTWQFARETMGEVESNSYTEQYNQSLSSSISSNQKYELLGEHFQQLGMNLPRNQAEAIVFKKGYLFKENKKKYLHVIFNKVDQAVNQVRVETGASYEPFVDVKKLVSEKLNNYNSDVLEIVQLQATKSNDEEEYLSVNEVISKYPIGRTKLFAIIDKEGISTKKGISKRGVPPTLVSKADLERSLEL